MLFDAFDGLLLLAKGGRMTYFGESEFQQNTPVLQQGLTFETYSWQRVEQDSRLLRTQRRTLPT